MLHAKTRAGLWERIRIQDINTALQKVGLTLPDGPRPVTDTPSLNKPLQSVLSEFVRRTRITLPQFVELMRGQTRDDYRPNKCMIPGVLQQTCTGYQHYDALLDIAAHGARVPLSSSLPRQRKILTNHKSAIDRYKVLVKNIRKEQDNWRCFVLDLNILEIWKEVHNSPFGVVDKGDSDPLTTGRTIHDLSFPAGHSLNDHTDTSSICTPTFERCDAIAVEVLKQKRAHPNAEVKLQAGDVNAAFRNVCTHSEQAFLFGGRLEQDTALVIDTSAAFGWSGSPATYGVVGGAIAFTHGNSVNNYNPQGMFNYYWVDDHINVAADIGSNCADAEQSLRHAMTTILSPDAVNEDKFTPWSTRQKALGLIFDTVSGTVSMPVDKVNKAKNCVEAAYHATFLSCSDYRSLLGRLRHVATRLRPARPFLQRLCQQESHLHRWQRVPMTVAMKQDLVWWLVILRSPLLNGVPMEYFHNNPDPAVIVEMDASDSGICALVPSERSVLRYTFSDAERSLIEATISDPNVAFDINYRELLSYAFTVHTWGHRWSSQRTRGVIAPVHVQFKIDNTSAVAW